MRCRCTRSGTFPLPTAGQRTSPLLSDLSVESARVDPEPCALSTLLGDKQADYGWTTPGRLFGHTHAQARVHVSLYHGSRRAPFVCGEGPLWVGMSA